MKKKKKKRKEEEEEEEEEEKRETREKEGKQRTTKDGETRKEVAHTYSSRITSTLKFILNIALVAIETHPDKK